MKDPTLAISKPARRPWTPVAEQARWVRDWEDSAETQLEFARNHGMSVATLRNWIRRHRRDRVREREDVEFRELDVRHLIGGPDLAVRSTAWDAEIRLPGGVTIAVAPGIPTARVRELIEAVRC